jgi:hypothetical protein
MDTNKIKSVACCRVLVPPRMKLTKVPKGAFTLGVKDSSIKCPKTKLVI